MPLLSVTFHKEKDEEDRALEGPYPSDPEVPQLHSFTPHVFILPLPLLLGHQQTELKSCETSQEGTTALNPHITPEPQHPHPAASVLCQCTAWHISCVSLLSAGSWALSEHPAH